MSLAERLVDPANSEEHFRTAVSRAYYSAYLSGVLKLYQSSEMYQAMSEVDSVHEQLQLAFSKKNLDKISDKLGELFKQRVVADYFPNERVDFSTAQRMVQLGRKLWDMIQADP